MKIFEPILIVFFLFLHGAVLAQESATSLAQKLQEQFLSASAVSFSFDLPSEGHIAILADIRTGHIRLESRKLLIASDGKTVWNVDKSANRETIDNVTQSSAFRDPSSLFQFANNYIPKIIAQHSVTRYTLQLTPNAQLQSLLSQAGGMETLTLELNMIKSTVKIMSASAASSNGTSTVKHLKIATLKSVPANSFDIKTSASTKVIDLRE